MARSQDLARLFQQPDSTAQRRYELCRTYFLEGATADQLAQRFQLHVGTVRAVVHDFARDPDIDAFFATEPFGRKTAPKRQAIQERAGALRCQGATLADIRATLHREGFDVSESFHSKFRDGFLDREEFESEPQAQALSALWKEEYNTERPHSSLGYKTPSEFAATCARDVRIEQNPTESLVPEHPHR